MIYCWIIILLKKLLLSFAEIDEELFEDNPEEYMRRDIEGADVDTRRRAACDLVKVLAQHFDEQVSQIFSQFVLVCWIKIII